MPAAAPLPVVQAEGVLTALGRRIRECRQARSITATAAARAAGLSRVTWHHIEQGQASVTMGAYLNAMLALGLTPALIEATGDEAPAEYSIPLSDYPQLRRLAWQLPATFELTPAEALGMYERHWRHLDVEQFDVHERALLERLRQTVGKGHLLV